MADILQTVAAYALGITFTWENLGFLVVCCAVHRLGWAEVTVSSPVLTWLRSNVQDL
jgi:hypothetical protein